MSSSSKFEKSRTRGRRPRERGATTDERVVDSDSGIRATISQGGRRGQRAAGVMAEAAPAICALEAARKNRLCQWSANEARRGRYSLNNREIDPLRRHPVFLVCESVNDDDLQDIITRRHLRTELNRAAADQPLGIDRSG